jgi:hypothetical protein
MQSQKVQLETEGQMNEFEGHSTKGSIEEALNNAIAAAIAADHPDAEIRWKLVAVTGRAGTIAGVREVKVVISKGAASH